MARWIKTDGTEQEVHPARGEFTNVELHDMVSGFLSGITLTPRDQGGLYMFIDDESLVNGKPKNEVATALLHQYRPEQSHIEIHGDVVIADLTETGDE